MRFGHHRRPGVRTAFYRIPVAIFPGSRKPRVCTMSVGSVQWLRRHAQRYRQCVEIKRKHANITFQMWMKRVGLHAHSLTVFFERHRVGGESSVALVEKAGATAVAPI